MNLLALDLTSSRLRALRGPSPRESRPLPLEQQQTELPMALSLEGRSPAIGLPGKAICRRSPHLACENFLSYLGQDRLWRGPKQKVTADRALQLIFDRVIARGGRPTGTVLTVPSWFDDDHLHSTFEIAKKAKLEPMGSLERPLAAALSSHREQPWAGIGIVIDVDDYAMTLSAVLVNGTEARIVERAILCDLNERTWKERLLALVSNRCVKQSRRDPRHSAEAEQHLYDQLEELLQASQDGRHLEVAVRSPSWYQNVIITPDQSATACSRLLQRAIREFQAICEQSQHHQDIAAVILTHAATRLPGLTSIFEKQVALWNEQFEDTPEEDSSDLGEQLLEDATKDGVCLHLLDADAPGKVAHEIACFFHRGALEPGHLEVAPLLDARPVDRGPARLQFRGNDYPLRSDLCTLGRLQSCDIVFESEQYPSVSGKHCEIVYDREQFIIHDLSRNGTLVNDVMINQAVILQPGDWIRLGPSGPLLRFLGQRRQRNVISRA